MGHAGRAGQSRAVQNRWRMRARRNEPNKVAYRSRKDNTAVAHHPGPTVPQVGHRQVSLGVQDCHADLDRWARERRGQNCPGDVISKAAHVRSKDSGLSEQETHCCASDQDCLCVRMTDYLPRVSMGACVQRLGGKPAGGCQNVKARTLDARVEDVYSGYGRA